GSRKGAAMGGEGAGGGAGDRTEGAEPGGPTEGQRGVEDHYAGWFAEMEGDFRGSSLNRLIASYVGPGRVLDIGCGTGGLSAELLRKGCRGVSQDVSERMVDMARRYLGQSGLGGEVRLGGVEDIPETGVFDTVVALDV